VPSHDRIRPPANSPGVSRRTLLGGLVASPAPAVTRAHNGQDAAAAVATDTDAELIRLCAVVRALEDEDTPGDADAWNQALRQVSDMRPSSVPALRAKVQLALALLPHDVEKASPAWASPDELLLWAVLRDALAWITSASEA